MPWARIDDQFRTHPKVVSAGPLAIALHVCALSYCAEHLTDGRVPRGAVNTLCDFEGVWDNCYPKGSEGDIGWTIRQTVERLITVGLWREVSSYEYEIHDYLEYNPSKAEIMTERERERGKKQRRRKGASRKESPNGSPDASPGDSPGDNPGESTRPHTHTHTQVKTLRPYLGINDVREINEEGIRNG